MQVSFLVPVYNTDPAVLTLCVNSVLKAAADRHQVVIVDEHPTVKRPAHSSAVVVKPG